MIFKDIFNRRKNGRSLLVRSVPWLGHMAMGQLASLRMWRRGLNANAQVRVVARGDKAMDEAKFQIEKRPLP